MAGAGHARPIQSGTLFLRQHPPCGPPSHRGAARATRDPSPIGFSQGHCLQLHPPTPDDKGTNTYTTFLYVPLMRNKQFTI